MSYIGWGGVRKSWEGDVPHYAHSGGASPLFPHEFQNDIIAIGDPFRVIVMPQAYSKMWHLVEMAKHEVGWLGTCDRVRNDFVIGDIFLLHQQVDEVETLITQDGLALLAREILDQENGTELWNRVRFWGHSHVHLAPNPSYQDDSQMQIFRESEHPFFVRAIMNKFGTMKFTIYLYREGFMVRDVPWSVKTDIDQNMKRELEREFKAKVRLKPKKHKSVVVIRASQENFGGDSNDVVADEIGGKFND